MREHNYYGGYALVRPKTHAAGGTNSTVSTADPKPAETTGLSRMNFSASNTDWMPSLMTPAAEARNMVTPICAMSSSTTPPPETSTRTTIFQALWGKRNFYRGVPLCVSSSNSAKTSSTPTLPTNATKATKVSSVSGVFSHDKLSSKLGQDNEVKKKLPTIPLPIGSDTWTAFTDTVRTATSAVVATRQTLKRPVAPMAVGITEADLERGIDSIRIGPEPLFRDLFAASFPIERPACTDLVYNNMNSSVLKEPMTVDGFVTLQRVQQQQQQEQQAHRHPVPPAPISVSPLLSPHTPENTESVENLLSQQKLTDSPKPHTDEGHYVPRALLDEINMGTTSIPPSPSSAQQQGTGAGLQFAVTRGGGSFYGVQQGGTLKEGDEELQLFDDDEDAAERIRCAINILMSLSVSENNATVDTDAGCEAKRGGLELDMEWLSALSSSQQQPSFFHGF